MTRIGKPDPCLFQREVEPPVDLKDGDLPMDAVSRPLSDNPDDPLAELDGTINMPETGYKSETPSADAIDGPRPEENDR